MIVNELKIIKDVLLDVGGTSGAWDFGDGTRRKWNDMQKTSRDIRAVLDYLIDV
jgi:hypothetical protein